MLLVLLVILAAAVAPSHATSSVNNRPVIGILTEQVYGKNVSFIAADYVKFLESAGARVLPIMSNSSTEELKAVFNIINGVLFPGGALYLNSSHYGKAGSFLYDLAIKANDNGDYFPLWGTCLGFELLGYLATSKNYSVLSSVDAENLSLPLDFKYLKRESANSNHLFSGLSSEEMKRFEEPLTFNNHHFAITVNTFLSNLKLHNFFNILSTSKDRNGIEFVSSMEAVRYPFYGVQWHPEKSGFEWNEEQAISHSQHAVWAMQTLADFFINEARRSNHTYSDGGVFKLIYSYQATYTGGRPHSHTQQKYYF